MSLQIKCALLFCFVLFLAIHKNRHSFASFCCFILAKQRLPVGVVDRRNLRKWLMGNQEATGCRAEMEKLSRPSHVQKSATGLTGYVGHVSRRAACVHAVVVVVVVEGAHVSRQSNEPQACGC